MNFALFPESLVKTGVVKTAIALMEYVIACRPTLG
jgi:hypothetical protein